MKTFLKLKWSWWRNRLFEISIALMLTTTVVHLSTSINTRQKELLPPSAWFEVTDLFVPDHVSGSGPEMIYDRKIRENFVGFWVAEVQRRTSNGLFTNACSGSGTDEYDPTDFIEENVVEWEWFFGKPCAVPPGEYRIKATYMMSRAGWPEKRTSAVSNMFTVLPVIEASQP